jgi:hypothetical protein
MMLRLLRYLIAILLGNAIYFWILPHLPPSLQHEPLHLDWGVAVDFAVCLLLYGVIRMIR